MNDVHKAYGSALALRGVSISISRGEILALLGPNGAGKTTLISIIAGLRRPDSGDVLVDGVSVVREPKRACQRLGLAPQDLGVYQILTVRDNLTLFGELAGLRGQQLSKRIEEVATALHLTRFLRRAVHTLSGGERRRVHTAMALLGRPPLLLLDEVTTGVDVQTRSDLLALVQSLANDGAAICYSTHYLAEVETLNASVAILDEGRVIAAGPTRDLVAAQGTSGVQLVFDGPAPARSIRNVRRTGNSTIWVESPNPTEACAAILSTLGDAAKRLISVELIRPSLDSVFFSLTGRRFGDETPADESPDADVQGG